MNSPICLRAALARRLSLACYLLLLALISLRSWAITELEIASRAVLWGLQAVPLLLFLPGLWRGSFRIYVWLCFALLIYFLLAVERVAQPGRAVADGVELAAIVLLFVSAMMFGRWQARAAAGRSADA